MAIGLLMAATPAMANVPMLMTLQVCNYTAWWVYVLVTVALEAVLIGPRCGIDWISSLILSAIFNAVTAFIGTCFTLPLYGFWVYPFTVNPHPFPGLVVMLASLGVFSAVLEGFGWMQFCEPKRAVKASFIAHLVGVPVALAILLFPAHPYSALGRSCVTPRYSLLSGSLKFAYEHKLDAKQNFPRAKTIDDLLPGISQGKYVPPPEAGLGEQKPEDMKVSLYLPDYRRFDFGEQMRQPLRFVFNPATVNWEDETWLVKTFDPRGNHLWTFDTDLRLRWDRSADLDKILSPD